MKVKLAQSASVGAKVIRKDGVTTELGTIAKTPTGGNSGAERLKRWWKKWLNR